MISSQIDELLASFQTETRQALLQREQSTFDGLAGPFSTTLVLFGAGQLGRFTLAGLRKAGIEPLAFADNNPRLHGRQIDGLEVLSPIDAAQKYNRSAAFIVTVYSGTPVRKQLSDLGCEYISPIAPLFWKHSSLFVPHSGIDLPHSLIDQTEQIRAGYAVLADDLSRRNFYDQLRWRYRLNYDSMAAPSDSREIYFPPDLFRQDDHEVFVDCGAFNGDSIRSFLIHRNNQFGHIYGLEPDASNRVALQGYVAGLQDELGSRISILPYAVGTRSVKVGMNMTGTAGSRMVLEDANSEVDCRALDDLFIDKRPTHIKMDIEGAEPDALNGAHEILKRDAPVLSVCVYHRSEHLWQIPLLIHSIAPDYKLFLRRYAEECWEGVCYAVPPNRCLLQ
jgi:FkbM family methyltransferase